MYELKADNWILKNIFFYLEASSILFYGFYILSKFSYVTKANVLTQFVYIWKSSVRNLQLDIMLLNRIVRNIHIFFMKVLCETL